MKKFYLFICFLFSLSLQAQDRYLDASFGVEVTKDIVYGTNISILTGAPAASDLLMDIYMPSGDTETARPVMLVAHTGSFLPPLFNGGVTGARSDSATVNLCRELASRGYVAVAYTYRQGWLPTSTDENIRRSSLLQAAFRGIQDTRSCIRFFRKDAAENGNSYGIDPGKIGIVGVGTGGYLSYGAGSLYSWDEVLIDKFIDTETAQPYIDSTLLGNQYGDTQHTLCLPNSPGYSSDVSFAFNVGGACGDLSWIDGDDNEPAFAGVHCVNDIFGPYGQGPVVVPTTQEFVVNVAGSRAAIEQANTLGNNDVFDLVDDLNDPLSDNIEQQKNVSVTNYLGVTFDPQGTDNFYSFNLPVPQGSPWDWWDLATLQFVVDATNAALGTNFDAAALHTSGLATNPDMSATKGHAYIDTIMQLMVPRACVALDLNCNFIDNIEQIDGATIGLEIYPNPASHQIQVKLDGTAVIEKLYVFDIAGRLVQANVDVNANQFAIQRNNLSDGAYWIQIYTDKGLVTKEILFN